MKKLIVLFILTVTFLSGSLCAFAQYPKWGKSKHDGMSTARSAESSSKANFPKGKDYPYFVIFSIGLLLGALLLVLSSALELELTKPWLRSLLIFYLSAWVAFGVYCLEYYFDRQRALRFQVVPVILLTSAACLLLGELKAILKFYFRSVSDPSLRICPKCRAEISKLLLECPHCRKKF